MQYTKSKDYKVSKALHFLLHCQQLKVFFDCIFFFFVLRRFLLTTRKYVGLGNK